MVRGNVSDPDGMRFDGEVHMIYSARLAVTWAAFVAVTHTGKRGLVAFMWFFAVFGLPFAVILLILLGNPAAFVGSVFLSLFFTHILVKRHYLLKRTTAGLLKDRQT